MSFSSEVKSELAAVPVTKPCCLHALAYGMFECGHAFSASAVGFQTENETIARLYLRLLDKLVPGESAALKPRAKDTGLFHAELSSPEARLKLLDAFGHGPRDVSVRLNYANLECEQCAHAYLRGAFLSCGAVTNPESDYHLEFSVPYYNLARDVLTLLRDCGCNPKYVQRKGNYVVYLKESEQIEDCLTMMGAQNATLELMSVKMVKNIRNNANRVTNCESANIDKTVEAAFAHVAAVNTIEQARGLDSLPLELREVAQLRVDNPDLSLRELGELLTPVLSRSGVNHRLKKIMEIADELRAAGQESIHKG